MELTTFCLFVVCRVYIHLTLELFSQDEYGLFGKRLGDCNHLPKSHHGLDDLIGAQFQRLGDILHCGSVDQLDRLFHSRSWFLRNGNGLLVHGSFLLGFPSTGPATLTAGLRVNNHPPAAGLVPAPTRTTGGTLTLTTPRGRTLAITGLLPRLWSLRGHTPIFARGVFRLSRLSRLLGALSGGFGSRLLLSRLLSCLLGFRFLLGERLHLFALPVNLAGRLDALPDRNIRSSNRWHTLGSLLTRVRFLRAGSRFLIWLPCRLLLLLFAHRGGGECIFHLGFLDTGEVALHVKPSLLQFLSQLLGASASVLGYLVYPSLSHVTSPANLLSWFPIRFFEAVSKRVPLNIHRATKCPAEALAA